MKTTLSFLARFIAIIIGGVAALGLAGCATTTPTREISNGYAIFDIKARPEIAPGRIAEAIKVALQKNMTQVQILNGIPPSPLPEKAPRFQLVSPLKGSGIGALAAAAVQSDPPMASVPRLE